MVRSTEESECTVRLGRAQSRGWAEVAGSARCASSSTLATSLAPEGEPDSRLRPNARGCETRACGLRWRMSDSRYVKTVDTSTRIRLDVDTGPAAFTCGTNAGLYNNGCVAAAYAANRSSLSPIENSARRLRFEDDSKPRARRLRETFKGVGRWTHFPSLDSRDVTDCDVFMRRASCDCDRPAAVRLRSAPRKVELFTEGVVGLSVVGVFAPTAVEFGDFRHGLSSLASPQRRFDLAVGVFSVFLMKALRITTRCSFAAT